MDRERAAWSRGLTIAADAVAVGSAWLLVVWLRVLLREWWPFDLFPGPVPLMKPLAWVEHAPLALAIVPVWIGVLALQGQYRPWRRRSGSSPARLLFASALATVAELALLFLLHASFVSRTVVALHAFAAVVALIGMRALVPALSRRFGRRVDRHRVLLVGTAEAALPYLDAVARHPEWGIEPIGILGEGGALPRLGDPADLAQVLAERPVDEVYLTGASPPPDRVATVAALCDELGVRLTLDANFLGLRAATAEVTDFDGFCVLSFGTAPSDGFELAIKRALDLFGAAVGLLALAPLFAVVALLIRMQDGGPVFFVQERVGRYGRRFPMVKFRTMVVDAEARQAELLAKNEMSGPVFKLAEDPRVTRVGRFLRRSSIDELPQLYNVLVGQMSLVGPRPPLAEEVRRYERWQVRRLSMRPGMTCIWQVSGRNEVDFDRWMTLDLQYIDNWSLWLDLSLLIRTVPVVVRGTGAR